MTDSATPQRLEMKTDEFFILSNSVLTGEPIATIRDIHELRHWSTVVERHLSPRSTPKHLARLVSGYRYITSLDFGVDGFDCHNSGSLVRFCPGEEQLLLDSDHEDESDASLKLTDSSLRVAGQLARIADKLIRSASEQAGFPDISAAGVRGGYITPRGSDARLAFAFRYEFDSAKTDEYVRTVCSHNDYDSVARTPPRESDGHGHQAKTIHLNEEAKQRSACYRKRAEAIFAAAKLICPDVCWSINTFVCPKY